MEIPDAELKELLASVKALTETVSKQSETIDSLKKTVGDGTPPRRVLKEITERKVSLRRIDGKAVIGFRNRGSKDRPQYVYDRINPQNKDERLQFVDILLQGMTEPSQAIPVNYNEFLIDSERVVCLVKYKKETPWKMEQGVTKSKEVDGYSMVELDYDIPIDVIGVATTYTVELPEGGTIVVPEAYVNM